MPAKKPRRRKIRKVVSYICTGCYKTFPSGKEANAHYNLSNSPTSRRTSEG